MPVVLATKLESPIVSNHHINMLPFTVFFASHESRLTVSKPGRSQKCALGARNFSEQCGVQNHQNSRAAYSAKSLLTVMEAVCAAKRNKQKGRMDWWWSSCEGAAYSPNQCMVVAQVHHNCCRQHKPWLVLIRSAGSHLNFQNCHSLLGLETRQLHRSMSRCRIRPAFSHQMQFAAAARLKLVVRKLFVCCFLAVVGGVVFLHASLCMCQSVSSSLLQTF